ncbi:MAG: hypothetical protein ACI3W5_01240 [Faecousia sp.]
MKKFLSFSLALVLLLTCLTACGQGSGTQKEARLLSFSQANSVEEMRALNGQKVTIIGYMSTLSPVSGTFMYLMNLPYQSCPFCVPNTTELSNTIAVYAKSGKDFAFTDQAIRVTGVMDFGDYVDEFGYEYAYRIKDATYEIVDTSNMSETLKLWQQLASTEVISQVYTMFEYVNFLCCWPTYTTEFSSGRDYLYPADALYFIETDGAQFHYGFRSDYFDDIIATIQSVDETAFAELVQIIEDAKALSEMGYAELKNGNYTLVTEYSNAFQDGRQQYRLDKSAELEAEKERIFLAFSLWLAEWEL